MIEILDHIPSSYVPVQPIVVTDDNGDDNSQPNSFTVQDRIFFGGDQLTEERSRNAKLARSDGDSEKLEGILPKVEDWHPSRLIYQVCCHTKIACIDH